MEKDSFDQRDMTILVVDDEPRIRDYVRMNLELERYRVLEASNGIEAIDQLREHLPDLVVMDVMMPEMDGFETCAICAKFQPFPLSCSRCARRSRTRYMGLTWGRMTTLPRPPVHASYFRAFARCCAAPIWPRPPAKRLSRLTMISRSISQNVK